MEGGMLRAVLVSLVLFSGMAAGQPTTTFSECYVGCFILCIIVPGPGHSAFECSFQCLKECLIPKIPPQAAATTTTTTTTSIHVVDNYYFCNLGCASSLCSNISTKQNPGGEKVESCVDSCSGLCTKSYVSP